jgi:heterodisulfide reductase subunit A
MEDLSLHVLDVVENSVAASARRVVIRIVEDTELDLLLIEIADDGDGMDRETVQKALDPFFSTRGTKRIGLGVPLLAQAARECGGDLELMSELGAGTTVRARFRLSHPDRKPLGDMLETVRTLRAGRTELEIEYEHRRNGQLVTGPEAEPMTANETVRLTVDGTEVEVEAGSTVLQAAEKLGIKIPTLCHHRSLTPYGACRVCLVDVESPRGSKIEASCVYPAQDGLVVRTDSERVLKTRGIMLELLLARSPEAGAVRQLASDAGIPSSRFPSRNEDCILCGLCVRVCQERMGVGAITFLSRGPDRRISTPYDRHSPICIACGACQTVCPVDVVDLSKVSLNEPRPITSDYDMGLAPRPSIYIPFPQAIPKVATIDPTTCMHLRNDVCRACEEVCEADAIDFTQLDEIEELEVGAVILAPGFESYDPDLKKEFGYGRYPNVISSLQFERLLSSSGPFMGEVLRPSDHEHPRRVAWIQCVGSREAGRDYCSSVCCMYATKEAIIAKEHQPDLDCTIFFIDMRAFGKGFDEYYSRAKELGVRYVRCSPSAIREVPGTNDLTIEYQSEAGEREKERFDMVVLSTGLGPPAEAQLLADQFGIDLDKHGFAATPQYAPVETSQPGVYVCGPFSSPKDIPETVVEASASASRAMALLAEERNTLITRKEYPPEKDVSGQEPRIGVFVCHCGKNIGGIADVPSVVEYASTLPNVVYATDNLYTCSTDTQETIKELIDEHDLNRVLVASCSPRTHEPLFRNTCREAGLNEYLFEMANIRDQCTWVHMNEPEKATQKSKDLVRMALAKVRMLEPLEKGTLEVNNDSLVVGGGMAGMSAALNLADQGFRVHLVEKSPELGGNFRHVRTSLNGGDPQGQMAEIIERTTSHPRINVHLQSELSLVEGSVGNFTSTISRNGTEQKVDHGAAIVATGATEYEPTEYLYGEHSRVLTQRMLEEWIADERPELEELRSVVMIQCVGSRNETRPYCSRICCAQAVKNAIALKKIRPEIAVTVLYRDIRTYGVLEEHYTRARDMGVRFIRYEEDRQPEVVPENGALRVTTADPMLDAVLRIDCDAVVLAPAIIPREDTDAVGKLFKVPLNQDRFFLEAHMKLRPVEFATDGVFLCGLAHSPKTVGESIAQAHAAAARATTILSKDEIELEATISEVVDDNCDGCAYCIEPCPFNALSLIEYMYQGSVKKAVARDAALCKGCGVCQATCPKQGILIRNFRLDQLGAMVDAALIEA